MLLAGRSRVPSPPQLLSVSGGRALNGAMLLCRRVTLLPLGTVSSLRPSDGRSADQNRKKDRMKDIEVGMAEGEEENW
jgi:hypothetical protein